MTVFYMDNFRGFQNCTISLADVNFLVGENSTGKTSFLSLIKVLSSPRFWLLDSTEDNEFDFGHFWDIVSINARNKGYFRIGFADRKPGPKLFRDSDERLETIGILFTYVQREGMPVLHKCTSVFLNHTITLVFTPRTTRYFVEKNDKAATIDDFQSGLFQKWGANHDKSSLTGYKYLKDEIFRSEGAPNLFALSFVQNLLLKKMGGKRIPSFGYMFRTAYADLAWIAPIRTKPRRTYDKMRFDFSPEGEHTPYLVKKMLDGSPQAKKFAEFLRGFGRESGLFREVKVHRFGTSTTSPFELEILLDTQPLNIGNVGYGVSQSLPVVVELFIRPSDSAYAIQQPEVHLHPKAQAAIGELIFQLSETEDKKFIVETHSDYTVDRYRICSREGKRSHRAQIVFFERKQGVNRAHALMIDEMGNVSGKPPNSYRKFFLREELRVLGAS